MPGAALLAEHRPGSVHHEGGGAEVVGGGVEQLGEVVHGDAAAGDGVVLFDGLRGRCSHIRHLYLIHTAEEKVARFCAG